MIGGQEVQSVSYSTSYNNCRVIFRDMETEQTIADTKIIEHDRLYHTIKVQSSPLKAYDQKKISALIFMKNSIYQYLGNVRKSAISGLIEIALYKGREKEDRESQRYELNVHGTVKSIKVLDQTVNLHKPIDVMVVNISTNGVLVKTLPNCFYVDTMLQLTLDMGETKTILDCSVVRINDVDTVTAEYGCKFVST